MTPLCPRCLLGTELSRRSDAYLCPSPVCEGGVTRETYERTPRWRRVLGLWRSSEFERLVLAIPTARSAARREEQSVGAPPSSNYCGCGRDYLTVPLGEPCCGAG